MIFNRIKITPEQIKRAEERYEFSVLNNSMTNGGGNIAGALGEILVIDRFGDIVEDVSTFEYDLLIKGKKVEVKTKRGRNYPEPYHNVNIFDFNPNQQCDWYCFVIVDYKLENGWIVGWKSKEDFIKEAVFKEKGKVDDETLNKTTWTFAHDCHNLKISDLINPDLKKKKNGK